MRQTNKITLKYATFESNGINFICFQPQCIGKIMTDPSCESLESTSKFEKKIGLNKKSIWKSQNGNGTKCPEAEKLSFALVEKENTFCVVNKTGAKLYEMRLLSIMKEQKMF